MGGRTKSLVLMVLAVFVFSVIPTGRYAHAEPEYVLSGTFKNESGTPLPNYYLSIKNADSSFNEFAETDENGAWSATVFADTYRIMINGGAGNGIGVGPRISGLYCDGVVVTADMTLDLVLPTKSLTVTVEDQNGQPFPNAYISTGGFGTQSLPFALYTGGNAVDPYYDWYANQYTNALGQATLPVLPTNDLMVSVSPVGLPAQRFTINVTENTSTTATVLVSNTVSGTLKDSNNNALAGYAIGLINAAHTVQNFFTTDDLGAFSLQVPSDIYDLTINAGNVNSGYAPKVTDLNIRNITVSENMTLDLVMPVRQLTVTVLDGSGNPVTHADVVADAPSGATAPFTLYVGGDSTTSELSYQTTRVTNDQGIAMLPVFATTNLPITVYPDDASGLPTKTVSLSVTDDTTTTITYEQTFNYAGTLKDDDNNPLAGYFICLHNSDGSSRKCTTTDALGGYSNNVAPGTYRMEIYGGNPQSGSAPYISSLTTNNIIVSDNTTTDLVIPLSNLSVSLTDKNNLPVFGATIYLDTEAAHVTAFRLNPSLELVDSMIMGSSTRQTDANGEAIVPFFRSRRTMVTITPRTGTNLNTKTQNVNLQNDATLTIKYKKAQTPATKR